MREFIFITILTLSTSLAAQEQEVPYKVEVSADVAEVRSGPADLHYVTTRLVKGDVVEVFRHDPNGWYAIKPHAEDFGLVRAKYLITSPSKGTGQCTRDGVQVWVGTSISDSSLKSQEPIWQVQLKRGDIVRVIGKQQVKDLSGKLSNWYKIAPPSGEFRWIHKSLLNVKEDLIVEHTQTPSTKAVDELIIEPIAQSKTEVPSTIDTEQHAATVATVETEENSGTTGNSIEPKPFQPSEITEIEREGPIATPLVSESKAALEIREPESTQKIESDGWQVLSGSEINQVSATDATVTDTTTELIPIAQSPAFASNAELEGEPEKSKLQNDAEMVLTNNNDFADQLRNLEYELTMAVMKPVDQWQLEPYARAASRLHYAASDPNHQLAVNTFLKKIDSFQKLKRQYKSVANQPMRSPKNPKNITAVGSGVSVSAKLDESRNNQDKGKTSGTSLQPPKLVSLLGKKKESTGSAVKLVSNEEPVDESSDGRSNTSVEYDAVGWLARLYTKNGNGKTSYVLQDSTGKILRTVLPAPGVNLERYVDEEIGVFGRKGHNARYNLPHVTVSRAVVLSDLR